MTGWLDSLAHAPDPLVAFTGVLAGVAFVAGFSGLRRTRLIEDVPTARIRSAPQGYVELIGVARLLGGEPIVAPLSKTPCCWFRYQVERRAGRDWRVVQSGTSDGIFILRDDSADCVVDPEGAEVSSRHKRSWSDHGGWGGYPVHARLPSLGRTADLVVDLGGKVLEGLGSGFGEYRYSEAVILDGDPLYAIGQFRTVRADDHSNSLHEQTGAILREWKRRPETLRQRFDANRDGVLDGAEWERARTVARGEAARELATEPTGKPLHTLKKPVDGRYFLLSNLKEFGLLRRYRWRMRIGFGLFLLLGAALTVMLAGRL